MAEALAYSFEDLVGIDVSAWCDADVRVAHVELRRMIDRLEAADARVLAAVHHRTIHLGDGAPSVPVWSQAQTGQRISDARASLEAGIVCESLPLVAKAWADGELSTGLARSICRGRKPGHEAVDASMEPTLVDDAVSRDVGGLDAVIPTTRRASMRCHEFRVTKPDGEQLGVTYAGTMAMNTPQPRERRSYCR